MLITEDPLPVLTVDQWYTHAFYSATLMSQVWCLPALKCYSLDQSGLKGEFLHWLTLAKGTCVLPKIGQPNILSHLSNQLRGQKLLYTQSMLRFYWGKQKKTSARLDRSIDSFRRALSRNGAKLKTSIQDGISRGLNSPHILPMPLMSDQIYTEINRDAITMWISSTEGNSSIVEEEKLTKFPMQS